MPINSNIEDTLNQNDHLPAVRTSYQKRCYDMNRKLIATSASAYNTGQDLSVAAESLLAQLDGKPDLLIASYSSLCNTKELVDDLGELFPGCAIAGASTCRGALTSEGLCAFGQPNIALWGLCDKDGSYGVGFAAFEDASDRETIQTATAKALDIALAKSGRNGELPGLIWMHASPGNEEAIVETLDGIFDGDVSIVGGSAADESLEGKWTCFAGDSIGVNGVSLIVFFSSYDIGTSFQSGYAPTEKQGTATRCKGRIVYEIDGMPAALVYNSWTNNLIDMDTVAMPANVLGSSTLSPVGIAVGDVSGIPYFNLAHPETYTEEMALSFFCEIEEGQKLTLMSGSQDNIISRPGRVANEAIYNSDSTAPEVIGGLVVFCGGCLLAVEPRANEISGHLNTSMHNQPYLGCFTFGEQGCLMGGENRHGNLMISVTVFKL